MQTLMKERCPSQAVKTPLEELVEQAEKKDFSQEKKEKKKNMKNGCFTMGVPHHYEPRLARLVA